MHSEYGQARKEGAGNTFCKRTQKHSFLIAFRHFSLDPNQHASGWISDVEITLSYQMFVLKILFRYNMSSIFMLLAFRSCLF